MHIPESSSRHSVFDQLPEENFPVPISKDRLSKFQKELDKIAGLAHNGKSNVRILWAASNDESVSMHMLDGEKRARYRLYTSEYECKRMHNNLEVVEYLDVDICLPRFVVEQYHVPAEEAFASTPEEHRGVGYYSHLFTVAHHDDDCCSGREALPSGQLCLGLYREPGDADLQELRKRVMLRDALIAYNNIGEYPSYADLAQALRDARSSSKRKQERRIHTFEEMFRDGMNTYSHRLFSDDPSVNHHGKYKFIFNDKRGFLKNGTS